MIKHYQGESLSKWVQAIEMPSFKSLEKNIKTEVCIIGGGIVGLTVAYQLLTEGRKVCILEGFEIGSGQSGKSTAQLTYVLDEQYHVLQKKFGLDQTKLIAESHYTALKKIEAIIKNENISCELEHVNGYLFSAQQEHNYTLKSNREKNIEELNLELDAIQNAGLLDVYLTERIPIQSFDPGPALCFPNQLQFNPLKYMKALCDIITRKGGLIYTNSHVIEVKGGSEAFVKTQNECTVHSEDIIVASNSPINDIVALHTKQASYRTYVIGVEIPKGKMVKGLFWDTEKPYHYIRLTQEENHPYEILLIGGEDHKTGQNETPEHSYTRLENWTRKRFPEAGRVLYRWSGHVLEPVDGIAFIGRNPMDKKNVYTITGHSGNGMTYSMIAALLISDLIIGRKNPWEKLYNPSRVKINAAKKFIAENTNTIAQYKDWFTEKQQMDFDEFPNGEGIVYREGIKIIAAYKDYLGNLTLNSAICPHLGGVVRWNSAEKSWDCPCHGSRFDCKGLIIDGPAIHNLSPIESTAIPPLDGIHVWDNPKIDPTL